MLLAFIIITKIKLLSCLTIQFNSGMGGGCHSSQVKQGAIAAGVGEGLARWCGEHVAQGSCVSHSRMVGWERAEHGDHM